MSKKAEPAYFRYAPANLPNGGGGPAHNLLLGEVQPGHVYEVAPEDAAQFAGREWEPASSKDFAAQ